MAGHTNGKLAGSSDSASCLQHKAGEMCFPPVKTSNLSRCESRICAIRQFTQSQWDIYLIAKFPHKYELVKIHSKLTKNTKTCIHNHTHKALHPHFVHQHHLTPQPSYTVLLVGINCFGGFGHVWRKLFRFHFHFLRRASRLY